MDAPIIVNAANDEFYKQPIFYALGHFSKYVVEDSVRIDLAEVVDDPDLDAIAFVRPDGQRVVVILNRFLVNILSHLIQILHTKFSRLNRSDNVKAIALNDVERGILEINCPARSMHTVVYG